jgi:hypothetical protein
MIRIKEMQVTATHFRQDLGGAGASRATAGRTSGPWQVPLESNVTKLLIE